jgi:phosphoglycolate phosphatase-like HAD superfamily hydrolase
MALPHTFEVLNFLRARGTVYCITEGKCNYQHTKAMLTDIEMYVESVFVTNDKVNELKEFAKERGFDRDNTVMIGDSENDTRAGKNAEISTVCIKSGVHDYESFKIMADITIDDLDQLLKMLKAKD